METRAALSRPFFVTVPADSRERTLLPRCRFCSASAGGHMMNPTPTGTGIAATPSSDARQHYKAHGLLSQDGLNYFSLEVDGQWHGGWFRIREGTLEVYSSGQIRTAKIDAGSMEN